MPWRVDCSTKPATSSRVKTLVTSSLGWTPQALRDEVRRCVEDDYHRVEQVGEGPQGAREGKGRPVGFGKRDVLGNHLADHHVKRGDQEERQYHRDRIGDRVGDRNQPEQVLEKGSDGRLGEGAETEGAEGDPQLGGSHHQRDPFHRLEGHPGDPAAGVRPGLDLRATGRDQGELGPDEEGVQAEQADRYREGEAYGQGSLISPVSSFSPSTSILTRSTLSPSIRTTESRTRTVPPSPERSFASTPM